MAKIYGRADSEKSLLSHYPRQVKKMQDIPMWHKHFEAKMNEKDTGIFAFLKRWNKKRQVRVEVKRFDTLLI